MDSTLTPWLRRRVVVLLGLLTAGAALLLLGWYQKRGYVDLVAAAVVATEEGRFDDRGLEDAERNLFASKELLAYDAGVRAYAAGRAAAAARHFRYVVEQGQSPSLRAKASYNLGNLLALGGDASGAAEMYRAALRLDPADWDAKANLEMLATQHRVSEGEASNAALTQAREAQEDVAEGGRAGRATPRAGI